MNEVRLIPCVLASVLVVWVVRAAVTATLQESTQQAVIASYPVDSRELVVALAEANKFLDAISRSDLGGAYDLMGSLAKSLTSRSQWQQHMTEALAPFGKRLAGTFVTSIGTTSVPNAPVGHYLHISLTATFERATMTETITLLQESDGWHVVGYHLQPKL